MNALVKRLTSFVLSFALVVGLVPTQALATATDASFVTEGSYSYTSSELSNIQGEDSFAFREDCFMRSSHLACSHLMALSAQAAMSSSSRYGNEQDPYQRDISNSGQNVEEFLRKTGFTDVESNSYYSKPSLEDSQAVAVGHRQISAFGKTYTLIAVFPRSAGYEQEWTSDFVTGTGDMSEGFKAGRDEILRFLKQYVDKYGISGNVKVWSAGFSRGGAMANLVSGFLVDGGSAYLGEQVKLTSEDVYCYTFSTPNTIMNSLSKETELSVAGARENHPNDTPGEAWSSSETGPVKLDSDSDVFAGINYVNPSYDIFPKLPPQSWGYTRYGFGYAPGQDPHDNGQAASKEDMLAKLEQVSPYVYGRFTNGDDPENFTWKTFDLAGLAMVDDTNPPDENMTDFLTQRVNGLTKAAYSPEAYVNEGYQDALKSLGALFGMTYNVFNVSSVMDNAGGLVKPLANSYLAYAVERVQDEGRAASESEATVLVLCDLLNELLKAELDPNTATVDDLVVLFTTYLAENPDAALTNMVISSIAGLVPVEYKSSLMALVGLYDPSPDGSLEHSLAAFLKACACGADENSAAYAEEPVRDPKNVRMLLYVLVGVVLTMRFTNINPDDIIGSNMDGNVPLANVISLLALILKSSSTDPTHVYGSFADAANAELPAAIDIILADTLATSREVYDDSRNEDVNRHVATLKEHVNEARRALSYLLFYTEGQPYSAASCLRNAATIVGNYSCMAMAHNNEAHIAWALALTDNGCTECDHYIEHVKGEVSTCATQGSREYWAFHDVFGVRYFADRELSQELDASDLSLPKAEHDWGEWTVVKEATATQNGLRTRTCKNDPSHVESEVIPATGVDPKKNEQNSTPAKTDSKTSSSSSSSSTPKTGDIAGPWMQVAILSLIALAAGILIRKRSY